MNADVYKPIDCDYYDTLEVLAMRRKECVIEYIDERQQPQTIKNVIVDVFTNGAEEFIRLESGQLIRLDHLLVVDQRPAPNIKQVITMQHDLKMCREKQIAQGVSAGHSGSVGFTGCRGGVRSGLKRGGNGKASGE